VTLNSLSPPQLLVHVGFDVTVDVVHHAKHRDRSRKHSEILMETLCRRKTKPPKIKELGKCSNIDSL
jgi:hypothetical protein